MGRRKEIKAVAIASNIFYFLNHIYRSKNIFFTQNIRKELLLTKIIIGKMVFGCTQDIDYKTNVDFNSNNDIIIKFSLQSSVKGEMCLIYRFCSTIKVKQLNYIISIQEYYYCTNIHKYIIPLYPEIHILSTFKHKVWPIRMTYKQEKYQYQIKDQCWC